MAPAAQALGIAAFDAGRFDAAVISGEEAATALSAP